MTNIRCFIRAFNFSSFFSFFDSVLLFLLMTDLLCVMDNFWFDLFGLIFLVFCSHLVLFEYKLVYYYLKVLFVFV